MADSADLFLTVLTSGLVPLAEIDAVLRFGSGRAELAYTQSLLAVLYLLSEGRPRGRIGDRYRSWPQAPGSRWRCTGSRARALALRAAFSEYVRGRFGAAAVLTSAEALWVYLTGLVMAVYAGVRVRNRRRLKRWDAEQPDAALPPHLRLQRFRREGRP